MHENHLTYFKVENFKRFESFEMENIGQFNLITGDNNVGKTSILEALLFDKNPGIFAQNLYTALKTKFKGLDIQDHFFQYFINRNTNNKVFYYLQNEVEAKITILKSDEKRYAYKNGNIFYMTYESNARNIPLIYFSNGYENELTDLYSKYIQFDRYRKKNLLYALKTILPNIDLIEISTTIVKHPTLVIGQNHINTVMPLATFGDGAIKLFRILIDIVAYSGKRLMIDEIDAGIHHDRFPDFWRAILKACKENDVQLFATTHNWECLEFFKNVLEEPEMTDYQKDARHFEIKALRNGKIKAYHYDFEQFKFAIENNHEIRGGR